MRRQSGGSSGQAYQAEVHVLGCMIRVNDHARMISGTISKIVLLANLFAEATVLDPENVTRTDLINE